jgi:Holliday junction resolvase RusA-like endonuclease
MATIEFSVPGIPQGKGRARSGMRDGRMIHYTPEKTAKYQRLVSAQAQRAQTSIPANDPCSVMLDVVIPVPASWPKYKRAEALLGHVRPTGKPDLDNIAKAILDGCNGYLWKDDAQVVELSAAKRYGEEPMVNVTVYTAMQASGWSAVQQREIGL